MARYNTLSVTTASVSGGGGSLNFDFDLPSSNNVDIYKIKITPSGGTGTSVFSIYKTSLRESATMIYKTLPWDDAVWFDPIEDVAGVYSERGEGFVCRYGDLDELQKMWCKIVNNDASARTYDVEILIDESPYNPSTIGVPDLLTATATANGLYISSTVRAGVNNKDIDDAQFRAYCIEPGNPFPTSVDLRTAAEGGSFVHNGTTQLIITGIPAGELGATYKFTSSQAGRWYFAWRLHNGAGWSHWTDGNEDPQVVTQWVATNSESDTGPADDWQVTLENGPRENTIIVHATRPQTNGFAITGFAAQIKDASTGSWRALDANAGAAETHYDGSGTNHNLDPATGLFERQSGSGFGTAAPGDILLYDVRGNGSFTITHCLADVVKTVGSTTIETYTPQTGLLSTAHTGGGKYDQVRFKIVKAMWEWDTEGYMGGWQANGGYWDTSMSEAQTYSFPDYTTQEFVSDPIPVDPAATILEARVWFKNGYSITDGNIITSSGIVGGNGLLDGYLWTKFDDRNWWSPTLSNKDTVSLTLDANGRMTFADRTTGGAAANAFAGAVGRFRIMPDKSGVVKIRVQFTINQSGTFTAGTWAKSWGMWLYGFGIMSSSVYGLGYADDTNGFVAGKGYNSGAGQRLVMRHCTSMHPISAIQGALSGMGASTETSDSSTFHRAAIAFPTPPFDVELRLTIEEDTVSDPVGTKIFWKTYEYQIDGGGWNTIASTGVDPYLYERAAPLHWKGFIPVLGEMTWRTVTTGDNATLKQFEVINGLCVRQ